MRYDAFGIGLIRRGWGDFEGAGRIMSERKNREQRLFVDHDLVAGCVVACDTAQRNYLINVLRLGDGASVLVFNGRDGEWRAYVRPENRKLCGLEISDQVRTQSDGPDVELLFAPLKRARLDYMVQKATELGVIKLRPVITTYTQAERVNLERMRSNVIEAAEQCGVLHLPDVCKPWKLTSVLDGWDEARTLVFCDEGAPIGNPVAALREVRGPVSVLIGPEGGFSPQERERLHHMAASCTLSLGPRIMRADTAAVAALALVNAVIGDWQ